MRSLDPKTLIIILLAALLCVFIWSERGPAWAGGQTADGNRDMIAVTGLYGSGASVLWLIDTKSRQMSVYKATNGQGVELVGARRVEHDLKLVSYRDLSGSSMNPEKLEKEYIKYIGEGGDAPTPTPAGGTTPGTSGSGADPSGGR